MERRSLWRQLRRWTTTVCALSAGTAFAADSPRPAHSSRVVLLGPNGPVLMNVRLETGSQTIRQVRDSFCESLFKRLDADKSGKLEAAEQAYLPMFRRAGGGAVAAAQAFAVDGSLTEEGLKKYIDNQLGPLFSVEMEAPRADQTVRLVDALDADGDGVLSVTEVLSAGKALSRYDLDDDESLSVAELQPFPQSVRQAQREKAVEEGRGSRVFLLEEPATIEAAISELKKLYALKAGLEVDRCGLTPGAGTFDENKDGQLDFDELKRWMTEGPAEFEILATWRDRGLPPVLQMTTPRSPRIVTGKTVSRRQWDARLDGVPIQLGVNDNRYNAGDAVRLFATKAIQGDRDKNGYLDEAEFASLGTSSPFSAVDLNHDGMVKTEEIREYFAETSRLSQCRVVMTFGDKVLSLFQLMDDDRSNRLSPREMMTLKERVEPLDRNGNGQFDAGDFVSDYKLTISFAKAEGVDFTPSAAMQTMSSTGGVRRTIRSGPLWYQRMDRNRDGDISWREFLGPRAKFNEVDTNRDGLISKDEAEAADAAAKSDATTAQSAAESSAAP